MAPGCQGLAIGLDLCYAASVKRFCIYEVFKRLSQQHGDEVALESISAMFQASIADLDAATALDAARLSLSLRLPMADSLILATARKFEAVLWTQDAHFEGLPDVRFFPKSLP